MKNINDVLAQFTAQGLEVSQPVVNGKIIKCRTTIDKEKRGWYVLYELPRDNGDVLITGAFGYFVGAENFSFKVELNGVEISKEEQKLLKEKLANSKKELEQAEKARRENAAAECEKIWNAASTDGSNDYLASKSINAYGVRFDAQNTILIPLCDMAGRIHSLQYIYDSQSDFVKQRKRNKDFHSGGGKKGYFHLIGGIPKTVLLVAEGYATAATLHEATGLPVAVCFDAGNIAPVVEVFRKRHWNKINILICADDDALTNCMECKGVINITENPETCPNCAKPHRRVNAGDKAATHASFLHNAAVIIPEFIDKVGRYRAFAENKIKQTDFNDLHKAYGLHTVRNQIENFLEKKKWKLDLDTPAHDTEGQLKPINTADEMVQRFSLIYGMEKSVYDHFENCLIPLACVREITQGRDVFKHWQEHPAKKILREKNLGFDPTGKDKEIVANLFTGFDVMPKQGKCDNIVDLLHHLCGGMTPEGVRDFKWIMKWLAFPLQNEGAKMKTAVVVHGGQGVGKNLFFEVVRDIYGKYGCNIGQGNLESQFNGWASHKLFVIADEVATQQEKYQVKNKLKAMITDDRIEINNKNLNAYYQRNHMNMVFLSNDIVPVVLEKDDRRHMVIWCDEKPDLEFFEDIYAEIANGGIEALYYHLLYNVDCTGFDEHTKPIYNKSKARLIDSCLDNVTIFFRDWENGEIKGLPFLPAPSELLYSLYRAWCTKQGVKPASMQRFIDRLELGCECKRLQTSVEYAGSPAKVVRCITHAKNHTTFSEGYLVKNSLDMNQAKWFGLCAEKMQQAVNEMTSQSGGFFSG